MSDSTHTMVTSSHIPEARPESTGALPMQRARPYQVEAVEAITEGLAEGGRGQLHAACGSGKSYMGVLAGNRLVPGDGLVVVLVPSLPLVSQILATWRTHTTLDAVLAVCSDETVTDAAVRVDDIDAEVTTASEVIADWLVGTPGRRLVVSTYISAHRLGEGMVDAGVVADLIVYDEAHHLAGPAETPIRRTLAEDMLPALRRLFMTATPRIDDIRESLGGLSMANTEVFGPVLYNYQWARAISEGYLDDYRIVVMGVTERQALDLLQDEEKEYVDGPGAPDLKTVSTQAVIAKAARQYGLRRIIAFCHRLDKAQEFAVTLPHTVRRLPESDRPAGEVHADRISGEMDHRQRDAVLESLRHPPRAWTVLTNVRCLSEGVDVPSVDAVTFTHPKSSPVDIVQAVGRALRRSSEGTGVATIIVPIVVPDSTERLTDLEPGEFTTLWRVVRALRAHDETLGAELDFLRDPQHISNPQLPSRITINLPAGTSDQVIAQLKVLTVEQTTSSWWEGFGHARSYHAEHGHLNVKSDHVTAGGFNLGRWIVNARQHRRKGWIGLDRVAALDKIGMVWHTGDQSWEAFVREMKAFREQYGHSRVPQKYVSPSGYNLGSKVNVTRTRAKTIPSQVRETLDHLGMVWDIRALRWQELYDACQKYAAENGDLDVPSRFVTDDGYPLGVRLKRYRALGRAGQMNPAERVSLEELGFQFAEADPKPWRDFLAACKRYVADHGSLCDVRKDFVDATGYRLGATISYYRNLNNGTKNRARPLDPERKQALDDLGMVWRLAPSRDLTEAEAEQVLNRTGLDRATEIIRLVDEERVTQSSITSALGLDRSQLSAKIKKFRETGIWQDRR